MFAFVPRPALDHLARHVEEVGTLQARSCHEGVAGVGALAVPGHHARGGVLRRLLGPVQVPEGLQALELSL